jgi:hypothetical protein
MISLRLEPFGQVVKFKEIIPKTRIKDKPWTHCIACVFFMYHKGKQMSSQKERTVLKKLKAKH